MRVATSTVVVASLVVLLLTLASIGMAIAVPAGLFDEAASVLTQRPVNVADVASIMARLVVGEAVCWLVGRAMVRHGWPRLFALVRAWRAS